MTDSTSPPQDGPDGPIDAEFEPVAAPARKPRPTGGPGWMTILVLGAVAASGFGRAAMSAGLVPGIGALAGQDDTLAPRLEAMEADMASLRTELAGLAETLSRTEAEDELTAAQAEKLASVSRSLTTVQARLNSLQTELSDVQAAHDAAPVPAAAQPDPAILARLATLEQALTALPDNRPEAMTETIEDEVAATAPAQEDMPETPDAPAETAPEPTPETADPPKPADPADADIADAALAVSAIETAARRGTPFQGAYERLAAAMPDYAGLDRLAPISTSGAPTLSELRDQFTLFKRAALDREAATSGAGPGWMRTLFGDGITIRRAGAVSAAERLDTAESALREARLKVAINEVAALDEDIQSVFTDWLQAARNRQLLEDELESLRLAMIAKDRP